MPYKKEEVKNNRKKIVWIGQVQKEGKRKEKRFNTKKVAEAWEVKMRDQSSDGWQESITMVS